MKKRNRKFNKALWLTAVFAAVSIIPEIVFAATSLTSTIPVNAQVTVACVESQHGTFPNPLTIDTQTSADQFFPYSTDEMVSCSNGTVFLVSITSANGTAVNQPCTSGGVSAMALKSASWPSDTIAYTFICAGDTNGTGYFTGAGYNTARALGIGIRVAGASAQAAMAHNDYQDTVTITLTY